MTNGHRPCVLLFFSFLLLPVTVGGVFAVKLVLLLAFPLGVAFYIPESILHIADSLLGFAFYRRYAPSTWVRVSPVHSPTWRLTRPAVSSIVPFTLSLSIIPPPWILS